MKKAISKGKKGSKSSGSSKVENNVVIMKASDALKVEFVKKWVATQSPESKIIV